MTWQKYRRTNVAEMRPYVPGEDLSGVSISDANAATLGPGGMIARNPNNHNDQWYVAAEYFNENFAPAGDVHAIVCALTASGNKVARALRQRCEPRSECDQFVDEWHEQVSELVAAVGHGWLTVRPIEPLSRRQLDPAGVSG